ncbi:transcription termination/antitermination protein NusG [Rhizobium rhizosphaerae]|nr:transcription termination/antitermination NusG family protein [Xaviernesmea rhizosphaerae]
MATKIDEIRAAQPIEIREKVYRQLDKAQREARIRVEQIGMASQRIADDYPHLARWICLKVVAGRELAVEKELRALDVHAALPKRKGQEMRIRGRIIPPKDLAAMPGYLFVRCVVTPASVLGLLHFDPRKRVLGILGGAEKPFFIPLKNIKKMLGKAEAGDYDDRGGPVPFQVGERVRLDDCPFGDVPAKILSVDERRSRVDVEVIIFGRPTSVSMALAQIEKL